MDILEMFDVIRNYLDVQPRPIKKFAIKRIGSHYYMYAFDSDGTSPVKIGRYPNYISAKEQLLFLQKVMIQAKKDGI